MLTKEVITKFAVDTAIRKRLPTWATFAAKVLHWPCHVDLLTSKSCPASTSRDQPLHRFWTAYDYLFKLFLSYYSVYLTAISRKFCERPLPGFYLRVFGTKIVWICAVWVGNRNDYWCIDTWDQWSNTTVLVFCLHRSPSNIWSFMKAQTATNNWPWMRKCKLHWKRINGSAIPQSIGSKFAEVSNCTHRKEDFLMLCEDNNGKGFVIFTTKLNLFRWYSFDGWYIQIFSETVLSAVYDFSIRQYVLLLHTTCFCSASGQDAVASRSAYLLYGFRKSGYECSRSEIHTISECRFHLG